MGGGSDAFALVSVWDPLHPLLLVLAPRPCLGTGQLFCLSVSFLFVKCSGLKYLLFRGS